MFFSFVKLIINSNFVFGLIKSKRNLWRQANKENKNQSSTIKRVHEKLDQEKSQDKEGMSQAW